MNGNLSAYRIRLAIRTTLVLKRRSPGKPSRSRLMGRFVCPYLLVARSQFLELRAALRVHRELVGRLRSSPLRLLPLFALRQRPSGKCRPGRAPKSKAGYTFKAHDAKCAPLFASVQQQPLEYACPMKPHALVLVLVAAACGLSQPPAAPPAPDMDAGIRPPDRIDAAPATPPTAHPAVHTERLPAAMRGLLAFSFDSNPGKPGEEEPMVYVLDLSASPVVARPVGLGGSPALSPDGQHVAFVRREPRPSDEPQTHANTVWIAAVNGSSERKIAECGYACRLPRFGPDGTLWYVEWAFPSKMSKVWRVPPQGTPQLWNHTGECRLDSYALSSDGKRLFLLDDNGLGWPGCQVGNWFGLRSALAASPTTPSQHIALGPLEDNGSWRVCGLHRDSYRDELVFFVDSQDPNAAGWWSLASSRKRTGPHKTPYRAANQWTVGARRRPSETDMAYQIVLIPAEGSHETERVLVDVIAHTDFWIDCRSVDFDFLPR